MRLEAPLLDPSDRDDHWRQVARVGVGGTSLPAAWSFEGLPPGPYAVRLVQGHVDSGPVPAWIEEGDVGGIELVLPAGAGIAGTVLTAEGETALGAVVELQRIRGDGDRPASGEDAPVQTCDHDGAYAFGGLAPGLWRVVARDGDAAPDVAEVRVEEGENLVVRDLTVGGGGAISGRVEDSRGRRLDGAALELDPFADGFEARTFTTRADGTFREDGLRAGLYRLTLVSKAGAYTGAEALVEVTDGETTAVDLTGSGRAEIEGRVRRHGMPVADAVVRLVALGEGLEEPLRVLETTTDAAGTFAWRDLPAGGYAVDLLDGIVGTRRRLWLADSDRLVLDLVAYEGRIEGRVISPSGRGVGGAWVRARATPGALADVLASRARTRPDGRFVFAGLPPGTYDLYASSPGLPPGRWRGAIADVGAAVEEVEIPLGVGGTLALHVVDRDGKGVPEARVWLETEEGRSLTRQPYAPTGSGRLRLAGVPPGRWWVRVEASGYGTPPRSAVAVHEQTTTPLEVVLPRPARLVVTVRSQAGVVPPARVDLVRESDGSYAARQETVRAEGLWNLAGRVPRGGVLRIEDLGPGAYRLRVSAGARYETVEVPVALVVGESARVEVVLPFAAR